MNFELTAEQEMWRASVRDFCDREVAPRARHADETGAFNWEAVRKGAALGLLGLNVPEAFGGAGVDAISAAIAVEELGRACGSTALALAAHNGLACAAIANFGSDALKHAWLPRLASGQAGLGALALTEPGAGSDLAGGVRTRAVEEGDSWIIDGQKMWTTNASLADAIVVLCRTDSERLSLILVPTQTPGITIGAPEKKMGLHGSPTHAVSFEEVRVPRENLVGAKGKGLAHTLAVLDGGRIGIGALAVGLAQGAFEAAVKYAHERQAFGEDGRGHVELPQRVLRRLAQAAGVAVHQGGGPGQALRHRDGRTRLPECHPSPRRLWVFERVPGGAHVPRCAVDDHRRGVERDPAAGHRQAYPGDVNRQRMQSGQTDENGWGADEAWGGAQPEPQAGGHQRKSRRRTASQAQSGSSRRRRMFRPACAGSA